MRTAAALVVHPQVHREEIDRFRGYIVAGPDEFDCDIWVGAVGGDGYGRFRINRDGYVLSVRPNRYALALAAGKLAAGVLALHQCDNPICVRVGEQHIIAGTQGENMLRRVQMRRGVQRTLRLGDLRGVRRQRSVALREAVRDGWNGESVEAAWFSDHPPLWWDQDIAPLTKPISTTHQD